MSVQNLELILKGKDYWNGVLSGEAAGAFPADKNGTAISGTGELDLRLSENIAATVMKLSNGSPARVHLCLLAGVAALLYKYNSGQEILIGAPVYKQASGEDLLNKILLFRMDLTGKGFKELLMGISKDMKDAVAHQNFPLNTLLFQKKIADKETGISMIDVFVLLDELHEQEYVRPLRPGIMFLFRTHEDNSISCRIEYSTARFSHAAVNDIANRLLLLMGACLQDMMQDLAGVSLLSDEDRELISSPPAPLTSRDTRSIISLFEEQAGKTPGIPALCFENQVITYGELNGLSNQFAAYLQEQHGIVLGDRVAIRLPRSPWMIVAILGVLKAGAAYIPIDPEYPAQRIAYIEADSQSKLLIEQGVMEQFADCRHTISEERIDCSTAPDQLVYIIYTSGSTGAPKGVAIKNSNLVNYIDWANSYYFDGRSGYCFGLFTSLSFDLTITSIFTTLLRGDKIFIFPEGNIAGIITDVFSCHPEVNTIKITPSHLNLARHLGLERSTIDTIILGGEQLKKEQVAFLKQLSPDIKIYNEYGPTETTVGCTCVLLTGNEDDISIGRPIRNTNIYITDAHGNLLPPGIPGEIIIGGAGVAVGYYNNEAQTNTKFCEDLYAENGGRAYRSGDLGKWLHDGNILYIGRKDGQVKINGFRIETDEVEYHLVSYPGVTAAVVLARHTGDEQEGLYAFFVSDDVIEPAVLREFMQASVPAYMIPHYFCQVSEIPLTPNGKVDEKALQSMYVSYNTTTAYTAPRNDLESELCLVWQEILGKEQVGVLDDFFSMGGHSLKATRLMTRYRKQFGVHLSLQEIFMNASVARHAALITQARREQAKEIPVAAPADSYPLSNSQKRLWLLSQRADSNTAYNIPAAFQITGELDLTGFNNAVDYLIQRHEIFRTSIRETASGEPAQWITPANEFSYNVGYHDLTGEDSRESMCRRHIEEMMATKFDLAAAPLFRLVLLKMEIDRYVLLLNMHHIISDAWSMEVFTRELFDFYNHWKSGITYQSSPLRIQYKDYAVWQNLLLDGEIAKQSKEYWSNQLNGELPVLTVPANKSSAVSNGNAAVLHMKLEPTVTAALKQLTRQHGATVFMGLLAAVKVLLHRYTGQEDLLVGTPVAGREHADLENQIGFYVNTLAIRTIIDNECSFSQLLDTVKNTTLEAYAHQDYPFDLVAEDHKGLTLNIMVDMRSDAFAKQQDDAWKGLKISAFPTGPDKVKFDLNFSFAESADDVYLTIKYNTDKYTQEFIDCMGRHFTNITERLCANARIAVKQINMLGAEEQEALLQHYSGTAASFVDVTVVDLFRLRVEERQNEIAVVYKDDTLTYGELDERSNRLGHYLQQQYGIKPEEKIGILLDRSYWWAVAVLGILKAGGAYVPIDPDYPEERVKYIMEDSGCRLLLDEEELSRFKASERDYSATPVTADLHPANLLYVIYTSGSTGQPKGVEVAHRSAVNIYYGWKQVYGLEGFSVNLLQLASISFDVFFGDVCRSLLMGGKMVICPSETKANPEELYRLMEQESINILESTPALLLPFMSYIREQLLDLSFVKVLILGSDTLNIAAYRDLVKDLSGSIRVINSYGTTEATIDSLYYEGREEDMVVLSGHTPIGYTFPNISAFILDASFMMQPAGVAGELCIGGAGLARGYLGRPELTGERFIPHPYRPGERLYRTGDLAFLMDNGAIGFLGRKDHQVKIYGFRIEPAEIENALCRHTLIEDALVIAHESPGGSKELVAYIISEAESGQLTSAVLRAYLAESLPAYMLPVAYIQLKQFPLTPNGKIDRKALPLPALFAISAGTEYVAPANEKERLLVEICEQVLQRKAISTKDDFFVMGGDSIKSIQIVSRLRQRGYQLQVRDVLSYPCIAEMARHMQKAKRAIPQQAVQGPMVLSPVQRAFLESGRPDKHHYNQSVMLYSSQRIDEKALKVVLSALVAHHDALRISFNRNAGGAWEQYNNATEFGYRFISHEIADEENWQQVFRKKADLVQAGFDLSGGALFHTGLFHCPDGDHILLVIHHLLVDSVSWRILLEDLSSLYSQIEAGRKLSLPAKTDSFQYWMEQQQADSRSGQLSSEQAFWNAVEKHPVPVFPVDLPEGSNYHADRQTVTCSLENGITNDLQTRCHTAYKTEINDILLTALGLAVQEVLGINKFHVNLEGHGREAMGRDVDVTRTVGWFTSQFPVLIEAEDHVSMTGTLVKIKEQLHRIPNNGIGYGMLRYLARENAGTSTFIAPVTFNYLGEFTPPVNNEGPAGGFTFSAAPASSEVSPLQQCEEILAVTGMIMQGKLQMSFHYSKVQYQQDTIVALSAAYKRYLIELVEVLKVAALVTTPVDLTYQGLSIAELSELNRSGEVEDVYELTPLQQGMYYHWMSSPSSTAYFEQVVYHVEGALDRASLDHAYTQIIARHGVLRTSFTDRYSGIPLQVVRREVVPAFTFLDLRNDNSFDLEAYISEDLNKGFNLEEGSQMRLSVLQTGEREFTFLWSHHHILMDGWCTGIIIRDFYQLYHSHRQPNVPTLPDVTSYREYIRWLRSVDHREAMDYWKGYLDGYDTAAVLPFPQPGIREAGPVEQEERLVFSKNDTARIKAFCSSNKITENSFMQTVWGILLSKYNNTRDVVYGGVVSGRPAELTGVEEMIGLFINTVPVRINYEEGTTAADLLRQVQRNNINSLPYHHVQLAEIQAQSKLGNNLVGHLFTFQNIPSHDLIAEGIVQAGSDKLFTLKESLTFGQTNYDFDITIVLGESIEVIIKYATALYSPATVSLIKQHIRNCTEDILQDPTKAITDIRYITDEEILQLKNEIAVNTATVPSRTVPELFSEQVARRGEQICLVYGDRMLSYNNLDALSNRFAHFLQQQYGLHPGDRVSMQLERSEWLIITMLAILKQGCVYIPVDPFYPAERITHILSDSGSRLNITKEIIAAFQMRQEEYPATPPDVQLSDDDSLYMIYTSGSTGRPKGVTVTHRNAVNICEGWRQVYQLDQLNACLLQMASVSFDVFFGDVCRSLLTGGRMVICSEEEKLDLPKLYSLMERHAVNIVEGTPMHIIPFMEYVEDEKLDLSFLKILILGSDTLTPAAYEHLCGRYSPGMRIINTYGTTEATIDTTYFEGDITQYGAVKGSTPIGRPFLNNYVYILDKDYNILPYGVPGEICIGGEGVSQGYWDREELTRQKFRDDPWFPGKKMYCTGDIGRRLEDGTLTFTGRIDNQVKIRGYRIEPGEIEDAIREIDGVAEAVVLVRRRHDDQQELIAFFSASMPMDAGEIKTGLREKLPDVMIPAGFVQVEEWPLTANGKVDRQRLEIPENITGESRTEYMAPSGEIELKLAAIWQELLRVEQVGVKDNFFDLGGHSITIMRLISMVRKEFDLVIPIRTLFELSTIEQLAQHIRINLEDAAFESEDYDVIKL
ncbi:non-ribosomal peptide synthetase [Chitinophaga sp. S165]|uniref:non-ribosomal peptide synthetase n=1 Tax=Chitinophaga sp. S165 TaxID=2135462 RepID=UPI000D710AD7|nr:non-ribosomal peptide synthetase [Chitinophaga sp. S165]PWV46106.1 non-ribosomal peptide synthase protein (TIGR01720 family)/amino acid adenylation domain-containing protein [Chitinophaga sp. S165]